MGLHRHRDPQPSSRTGFSNKNPGIVINPTHRFVSSPSTPVPIPSVPPLDWIVAPDRQQAVVFKLHMTFDKPIPEPFADLGACTSGHVDGPFAHQIIQPVKFLGSLLALQSDRHREKKDGE